MLKIENLTKLCRLPAGGTYRPAWLPKLQCLQCL